MNILKNVGMALLAVFAVIVGLAGVVFLLSLGSLFITAIIWYVGPYVLGAELPITFYRLWAGVFLVSFLFRAISPKNRVTNTVTNTETTRTIDRFGRVTTITRKSR